MVAHYPKFIDEARVMASPEITSPLPKAVSHRHSLYRNVVKRAGDVTLVLLAVPFVLPIVLFLAALVALDGHNPFYSQQRVGRGGRSFTMWKLRSMVPDADCKLEAYLAQDAAARSEWDLSQKLRNDPRITPFGRIIRKSSMDELPQLWNVLAGHMSLVGPRPMMPEQQALYPGRAYFALRPGITGPWQISDRNQSSFAARAKFDADYFKALSFRHDVHILVRTVNVVIHGTGC
jgi:exopolysaccharide production protein ExoY